MEFHQVPQTDIQMKPQAIIPQSSQNNIFMLGYGIHHCGNTIPHPADTMVQSSQDPLHF